MITSQDIKHILCEISRRSKKVDELPAAIVLRSTDTTRITSEGIDHKATLSQITRFIAENLDLGRVPISIDGLDKTTLFSALVEIYAIAKAGGGGDGISYSYTDGNFVLSSVTEALNYILNVLLGKNNFPSLATTTDINNIFNS